jgi:hypothetical protein
VGSAALRAFGKWVLAATVAFALMEIAQQVFPRHPLTLMVVGVSIGAATLGWLSYLAEKAAMRRLRSRRAGG